MILFLRIKRLCLLILDMLFDLHLLILVIFSYLHLLSSYNWSKVSHFLVLSYNGLYIQCYDSDWNHSWNRKYMNIFPFSDSYYFLVPTHRMLHIIMNDATITIARYYRLESHFLPVVLQYHTTHNYILCIRMDNFFLSTIICFT